MTRAQSQDSLDDAQLVHRCRSGDESAWRILVRRYQALVYSTALRTGVDEELAGDVFQQVWLEVHRSLDRIRDPKALAKWLIVTTRRISYKAAARRDLPVEGVLEDLVDPRALAHEELEKWQTLQTLEMAISELGGTCAKLLRLLFLDEGEPKYEEIASRAGIAIGSIGPLRARCLSRLRERLTEDA